MTSTTAPKATIVRPVAGPGLLPASLAVAQRALRKYARTPQLLIVGLMQGLAFLLIFRYVFGGAIETGSLEYVDFMVPGILVVSTLFLGMSTAVAIAEDMQEGFFDRLRSLPMPAAAVTLGRAIADSIVLVAHLTILTMVSFGLGFRVHTDWFSALAGFALCALFGFVFVWLFIALGLLTGNVQAAQGVGFLVLPLSFASGAYVPVETMPTWLRAFAEHQPITVVTNAIRALTQGPYAEELLGHTASYFAVRALLWVGAILVVFMTLAIARSRRK
ncbi:MAG: ABC transporter permease [Micrococcaceae bacterium]|uniref:ABC transporter permease n=1 Tax=Arthrobacter rhombi TaxID=71253 RepID=UPI00264F6A83|nr:ABC transporter permease [Micrococcaceae bacterium]